MMSIASGASSSNAPVGSGVVSGLRPRLCLHGFGRDPLKLSGLKLRKIVLANGASYWLRPSFIFSYMTGTVDELAYPLLLAAHGVPPWLLTLGFGHNDMFWYRLIERLGRTVWWKPPSATRQSCPSIWWRTSFTPTGPARRATSRQPLVALHFGRRATAWPMTSISRKPTAFRGRIAGRRPGVRPPDGQHRRLGVDAECLPDVVSPDHGGALFSARVLEDSRPLPKARELHRRVAKSTVPPLRRSFDA